MKITQRTILTATAIGMLAACGGVDDSPDAREKAMEQAAAKHGIDADVTVGKDGEVEQVVINSGAGQVGQNLSLPNGFPDDIPLPDDWNIMSSAAVPNGFSVQALSEDSAEALMADLKASMTDTGWTVTASDQPTPQMSRVNFEKDGRMANFNIMLNGETRVVQLMTMVMP
ncbi:MAG: hypothetical protein AAGA69_11620 [Pseudomonadota bacterium]